MNPTTLQPGSERFSAQASLAAVGIYLRQGHFFRPIQERVQIGQKVLKYTPVQKLYDGFIAILAGAHGLVEINKLLRADPALQAAFGRAACAEQSVVQDTLDACTTTNVAQLEQAMDEIYRQHSRGYRHDYAHSWQLLDADTTGMPCGKKAALASKGYFAKQRNRRGRQLGRVVATWYQEIVVDRLFSGTTQLTTALRPLVEATERTLGLDEAKRQRTIWRIDAGGGSVADVNWLLARGYQVHCKDYSGLRAQALAKSVTAWVTDPQDPGRQAGWVTAPDLLYIRPLRRLAVRSRKANGQWGVGVILATLSPSEVIALTRQPLHRVQDPLAVLWAYVYFYDQRGGGVESTIKGDKQGLGMTKRNKKRFAAQQMVTQLTALVHNVLVWLRDELAYHCPKLTHWGMLRLVRDVLQVRGKIVFDAQHRIVQIILNQADPLTKGLIPGLAALLAAEQVAVISGET